MVLHPYLSSTSQVTIIHASPVFQNGGISTTCLKISKHLTFHKTEARFEGGMSIPSMPGTEVSFVFGLEASTNRSFETKTIVGYKSHFHLLVLPSCQAHLIIEPHIWPTPCFPSHRLAGVT